MNVIRCGSGEPILFIHGMPTSGRLWKGIIDRLCERYTCIAVDLPGLGNSPREPYDLTFCAISQKRLTGFASKTRSINGISWS